jgi:hypothetical protein
MNNGPWLCPSCEEARGKSFEFYGLADAAWAAKQDERSAWNVGQ